MCSYAGSVGNLGTFFCSYILLFYVQTSLLHFNSSFLVLVCHIFSKIYPKIKCLFPFIFCSKTQKGLVTPYCSEVRIKISLKHWIFFPVLSPPPSPLCLQRSSVTGQVFFFCISNFLLFFLKYSYAHPVSRDSVQTKIKNTHIFSCLPCKAWLYCLAEQTLPLSLLWNKKQAGLLIPAALTLSFSLTLMWWLSGVGERGVGGVPRAGGG